jgi:PAS domain S-box-containing protein
MADDPEQMALRRSSARDSEADLDLRSYDWRALIEQLPLAVYIDRLDEWSSNVYTSPQLETILGYTADEWAGENHLLLRILHPDDRERVMAAHLRSCETGEPFREEYRMIARDGRVVWFLDEATVVPDQTGRPAFHHGFYLDTSERKALEEALAVSADELREQKHYFESLLEISPVAIVTTDLEDLITSWNPAAERLFGYGRTEAVGRKINDLVARSAELRAEAASVTRDALRERRVHAITTRTHKDGSPIDVELLAAPVLVDGELVGTYAIYHDISELQRRRQYLESLLELAPTAIVTVDLDYNVASWNPAAEKLFGYARQEAIGRNIDDLVARSDAVRGEAADISRQAEKGGNIRLFTRRTRKDGTLVDVDLRVVPIFVGGRQVGMYALYHDVSELLRARREAEAATKAKSAFLAMMSHEIRTPLNAVIGMTELLLGTELTPEQRELAHTVHASGDALLGVINEILDFSKIEAGRLELEHRPLVLRDCVETAVELVAANAAAKGLDVACLVDPHAPAVILGDRARLGQILVNLLANAVKFTEHGEVVLTVESQAAVTADKAGTVHRLHFTIRDTGIGIPAERIDRLFESFSQLDASMTRRYGGTGLGLAISKRLCEMMGGKMWAESEVGNGSTFHFTLPAEAASGPRLPPVAAELRGKRLLVVDDNAANREVITRHARSWGMVPRATGSSTQALAWIRRGDPLDVAILDTQMPEMDGLTLAREIRRYRSSDALPLVMLTSLGRRTEHREARGEFAAFLTKPIRASQLYNAVAALLGARTAGTEHVPEPARDAIPGTGAQLRILLAEDNAVNQQLALRLLEKLGYRADDVAANGLEALEALRRRPYDVVLMDVEMPTMDGLEAARCIHREWPGHTRPRIIAMTANAMQGDREACLAAGMDDYVSKPIRLGELAEALSRCSPFGVSLPEAPQSAPAPAHEGGVLDPKALEQLHVTTGDRAFTVELVHTFLREAPALLETLRGALEAAEAQQLRRAAHTLKSNGEVFGATRLAELCRELEAMAKAGTLMAAAELLSRIDEEYARVEGALRAAEQELA